MLIDFLALGLFLVFSAFFSGTETAFTSLSEAQVQEIKNTKGKGGRYVAYLTSRPDVLLTTVLVGNNLMNIAGSVMASEITIRMFGSAVLGITTGVLTLVVLIFGEVVPKQVALVHNFFWTTHVARLIWILSVLLMPVIWFMSAISRLVTRLSHGGSHGGITRESILYLAKHAETVGILEAFRFRMVRNVLRFTEVNVSAVMTHRTRVFSLDKEEPLSTAFTKITSAGFSRVPIYDGHPEHIVGVVILKELARRMVSAETPSAGAGPHGAASGGADSHGGASGGAAQADRTTQGPTQETGKSTPREGTLKRVMVEPIFVPENRKIDDMLSQFRRFGLNIAIVLDEYGGVSGIVTMEDVVEEILGEIYDEHEVQEADKMVAIDDTSYRLEADLPIYVANDRLGVEIPHTRDVQTIGGYIAEQLGRLPAQGETVSTPVGEFIIEAMARKRIVSVRFSPDRSHGEGGPGPDNPDRTEQGPDRTDQGESR